MKKRIRGTLRVVDEEAKRMRREPTPAEVALWKALRGEQVRGRKFRRQHPMGRFIIDFYCPDLKLCIEVDGKHHAHGEQWERDRERTLFLSRGGFTIIRFTNEEVLTDLPTVVAKIEASLPSE
jgi:very-short-patch-repair endonuclease